MSREAIEFAEWIIHRDDWSSMEGNWEWTKTTEQLYTLFTEQRAGEAETGEFEKYLSEARDEFSGVIKHYFPNEVPQIYKDAFRKKQWTDVRVAAENILIAFDQLRERNRGAEGKEDLGASEK